MKGGTTIRSNLSRYFGDSPETVLVAVDAERATSRSRLITDDDGMMALLSDSSTLTEVRYNLQHPLGCSRLVRLYVYLRMVNLSR